MTKLRASIPDLADKVVLVTGGSTGIGAAVVRAFAAQGALVAIGCRANRASADAIAREIGEAGGGALVVEGDVAKNEDCRRIVERTVAHFGRLDGLINNAGAMLGRVPSLEVDDDHLQAVLDLNASSVVRVTRAAAPHLAVRGGFVINTTSIAARNGGGGGAVLYAASKGFVSTITKGLAKELWPKKIRVNGVAPGLIATLFHERDTDAKTFAVQEATIPMGRAGTSDECVGAYLYLASDALSGYVIGQIIEINGGQLMP